MSDPKLEKLIEEAWDAFCKVRRQGTTTEEFMNYETFKKAVEAINEALRYDLNIGAKEADDA